VVRVQGHKKKKRVQKQIPPESSARRQGEGGVSGGNKGEENRGEGGLSQC